MNLLARYSMTAAIKSDEAIRSKLSKIPTKFRGSFISTDASLSPPAALKFTTEHVANTWPDASFKKFLIVLNESEWRDFRNHRACNQHGARIVFKDRRKIPRRRINRVAQFHSDISPMPRPCMVTDISEGGARLYSEIEMPPIFTLVVSGDSVNLSRECRVVWRLGGELGVEFIDRTLD